ncbi:hypothetical protein TELCIR_19826, partial [Teladorsagia circumcincta]
MVIVILVHLEDGTVAIDRGRKIPRTLLRCADVDHLTADVRVGARLSRIDEWCGDRTPPQLMSSTNLLQLEYTTK